MKYLPPTVCLNAFLLEPLFAQIWGVHFKLDFLPGLPTLIGAILITFSIYKYNTSVLVKNAKPIIPQDIDEQDENELQQQIE